MKRISGWIVVTVPGEIQFKHSHEHQFRCLCWKVKNNLCFLKDLKVLDQSKSSLMAPFVSTEGKIGLLFSEYHRRHYRANNTKWRVNSLSIAFGFRRGMSWWISEPLTTQCYLTFFWLRNSRQTVRVVKYGFDYQSQKFLWTAYEERITFFCSRDKINLQVLESEKMNTYIHIQKGKFTCL